mmetsp:Transcript_30298/g.49329  ORF Transcript_30298/g.49329 Transcript_30298/m.49329 type:complete len:304 (-) Transcript_30298:105-1016(-)
MSGSLLYESKEIGPIPCRSPNLVMDFYISLQDPMQKVITPQYGAKKRLFCQEWQNNIVNNICTEWDALLPSFQSKCRCYKYLCWLFLVLFVAAPVIIYFVLDLQLKRLLLVAGLTALVCLLIALLCAWLCTNGSKRQFRRQFMDRLMVHYVNELANLYEHRFQFTLLYPVVFYLSPSTVHSKPRQIIYCVLRVSDGIVLCDDAHLEPLYFTSSQMMKQVHSKYRKKSFKRGTAKNEFASEDRGVYTPRSDTNPPILHQMRKDNTVKYGVFAFHQNLQTNPTLNSSSHGTPSKSSYQALLEEDA